VPLSDSLKIIVGPARRPALFPQLFPIPDPVRHLVRQRESELMREHTHLPAMVGFVRKCLFAKHWGDFGGTPEGKDGEIRVRTGKLKFQPWLWCGAANGAFCRGCVETTGLYLAPQGRLRKRCKRLTPMQIS
jgi:hypothetical protein